MSWIKILAINILVFLGLLIIIEISARSAWTAFHCYSGTCDFSRILNLQIYNSSPAEKNIGLTNYDGLLGYKPAPGFSSIISGGGWHNAKVTIESGGFRSNGRIDSSRFAGSNTILAVGDSFTFGAKVSDAETWPSCLESKLNLRVMNAGVFGYGAAQAIRRASLITQQKKVDTVILSILINDDFHRDKLKFKAGFPRPAVIKTEKGLSYAKVPSIDSYGTRWRPNYVSPIFPIIIDRSYLLFKIVYLLGIDITGRRLTETHENAASIEEIIKFSIQKFAELDASEKFIVLQYRSIDFPNLSPEFARVREQVKLETQSKNILVIDTYNRLGEERLNNQKEIWKGHHTAYGNSIICEEIYRFITEHY